MVCDVIWCSKLDFYYFSQKLQDEIKEKKFIVKNAEDAGQWLIENSDQSPEVVREVHEKLASVSTPLETLQARVNEREVKLQSALMQTEEFDVILNDFDNSMKEIATVATKGIFPSMFLEGGQTRKQGFPSHAYCFLKMGKPENIVSTTKMTFGKQVFQFVEKFIYFLRNIKESRKQTQKFHLET